MNAHEQAARMVKVEKVLEIVWARGDRSADVAAYTPEKRREVARVAGCNPLSDTSWAQLVSRVKVREEVSKLSVDELFDL